MKKTIAIAVLLVLSVSALSFANGSNEAPAPGTRGQGYGRNADGNSATFERPFEQGKTLTLTGTLKITDGERPVIATTDGEVELMYPYIYDDKLDLKEGQVITVTGYDTPAYRWFGDSSEKHFMVTEATIDGKEYKLNSDDFGPRRGGRTASAWGGYGKKGGRW